MFTVKPYKTTIKGLHEIVDNFHSLLNDGENDIIYTGTNNLGNRIIGSIVGEDEENGFIRYFHAIISDRQYSRFVSRIISLRSILEESDTFYVIDKDYNNKIIDYNLIEFSDVDNDYLPLSNSLLPSFVEEASLDYAFSLKGGLSDLHKAEPEVMSAINSSVSAFLKSSLGFVKSLNIIPSVYSETALTGSFELNFKIELSQDNTLFSRPNTDITKFIKELYTYIFSLLPQEEIGALKEDVITSDSFKKVVEEFTTIFNERHQPTQENKEQQLIDLISYSVKNLKDMDYKGFDRIELLNVTSEGSKLPVAVIERDFYTSIENRIFDPESLNRQDIVQLDDFPVEYKIQVYQLNVESGKGGVYLHLTIEGEEKVSKTYLHLKGKNNYSNTEFTKSMDDETVITVSAIAKRINGKVTLLTYEF